MREVSCPRCNYHWWTRFTHMPKACPRCHRPTTIGPNERPKGRPKETKPINIVNIIEAKEQTSNEEFEIK